MKLFDLHCDTITECSLDDRELYKNDLHISIKKAKYLENWVQLFAIWIPDDKTGDDACEYFEDILYTYNYQMKKNRRRICPCTSAEQLKAAVKSGMPASILTVEGGTAVAGRLDRINYLYDCGVRVMTLTWNESNEIGSGCFSQNTAGLTDFGRQVVRRMQDINMIVDVSHLNEAGFYDVAELSAQAKKPFMATHSSSDAVYPSIRNLTNAQLKVIIDSGGVVGLNLFHKLIGGNSCDKVYAHICEMLDNGAQKALCIGSDFDGCSVVTELEGIDRMPVLYEYLLERKLPQETVDDIFFNNAYNFFVNNLT